MARDLFGDPPSMGGAREELLETTANPCVAFLARVRRRMCGLKSFATGDGDEIPPYSPCYELQFFFAKGIPLGLAAFLNWGIPPLLAMIFAGHTQGSAHLQASLGYGRVWFNCTVLMPTIGFMAYFNNVIPGCIGAQRNDRIPRYFQRSLLLTFLLMLPIYLLQFASGTIMHKLGVPWDNAVDISDYCKMMIVTAVLIAISLHLESVCINLGYTTSATLNSFLTGLGVDVVCTYLFIYLWGWGVHGAALAQIVVQLSRSLLWLAMLGYFGLLRKTLVPPAGSEALFSKAEFLEFLKLGMPQILGFFSGWLIFELQLMAMANIDGITKDALAAGAVWVQVESSLASAQDGWIRSTSMRSLNLLGKQDPGSAKAFTIFNVLALVVVAATNVPFLICQERIAGFVSNDLAVQEWLYKFLWVLAIHTMTRVAYINSNLLFVPLGRGMLGTAVTFVSFYLVATPFAGAVALTDMWTSDVELKMVSCVGVTSIAQMVGLFVGFWWLWRLDWIEAGAIINRRANMDKQTDVDVSLVEIHPAEQVCEETAAAGFGQR